MRKSRMLCAIASFAVLAAAAHAKAESATGEITEVGKNFLVLKVKQQSMRISVDSAAQITLDGKKAALTLLKKGHKATVTYTKKGTAFQASKIVASSKNTASLFPVVFLAEEKQLRFSGQIRAVNKTSIAARKTGAKKDSTFEVGSDCAIKVDGKTGSLKDLKVGQTVTISYVTKGGKMHAKSITAKSA